MLEALRNNGLLAQESLGKVKGNGQITFTRKHFSFSSSRGYSESVGQFVLEQPNPKVKDT